jgi:hypothetical protein
VDVVVVVVVGPAVVDTVKITVDVMAAKFAALVSKAVTFVTMEEA